MNWKIPLFKTYSDHIDIEYVTRVLERGSNWADGPEIREFEDNISEYIGTKHSVVFNSGTSALHALLLAHGLKQGDEVIVPSFTFIATANAPQFVGSKTVFAEIEDLTYGLDPEDVKEKITSKTKAIMPIHYGGCPCLINELREIAEDYKLLLFEDAAESIGAKIKNKYIGTFGDSAIFSFCQNKIISTGEGGAVITDSDEIYKKLKLVVSHGRPEPQNYFESTESLDYVTLGYNFRMSSLTAALGISQLKKIDYLIQKRRKNAEYMTKKLSNIKQIYYPKLPPDYFQVYQIYTIRVKDGLRNKLAKYLIDRGVMTKVFFPPVHLTHYYKASLGYKKGHLPFTEKLSDEVLSLPIYPTLDTEEMDYVVEAITDFYAGDYYE
ncbi:DegT/DnrJ/EryC1/StrS family aminotransferase [Methanosarcina mazei]|uniref:Bacillosamine/Legionaminic acid biosynthesis aminotransferase PglE n=2 Tax=Methanosarcina mazei TaxID=2209 RepID=A0A0E3LFX3_METMZ|nr:DegT/DnrJ/EryC1/StrS family aminotransferase [Methanosarcina mazei]AKB41521.1 Bacillosamine/Legionaminic acid biosynthesis aminotransferase PglE [Methanosarcina mazei WWM610]KKH59794.1 aminotransferase DegT [Methanosarcina mazei]